MLPATFLSRARCSREQQRSRTADPGEDTVHIIMQTTAELQHAGCLDRARTASAPRSSQSREGNLSEMQSQGLTQAWATSHSIGCYADLLLSGLLPGSSLCRLGPVQQCIK